MPSLFVIRGNDQGARFELDEVAVGRDTIGLGREASNPVQLHDTEVSRRHAVIRRQGKQYTLTDLGSSNGTYVNGRRIETHELASGDEVQLGSTTMLFTGAGEQSPSDLVEKIDIIARHHAEDRSRIVRSLPQDEGSRIFAFDPDGTQSPWLARARSNLQVIYRTALAVSHTLDIDQLLDRIVQLIFEWVEADRGVIMLVNPATGKLEPRVRRNRHAAQSRERLAISKTILDYVMERNEGVLTSDASEDDRWNPAASILRMGVREAICVPMQGRHSMVGVIYIDTLTSAQHLIERGSAAKFTEEHLKLLIAIAHQAALAVEDTRYYSALVQAERLAAVGQAIASLSHHIKNILQGIRGGSFLIKEGLSQHDENMMRKGWEFVEKNQERISNLVMDMLTFSKEREPELLPCNVNEVVGDVVELMEARAREHGVVLHFARCADLPPLVFDPEGIHRAVLNVITNAIDACEAEPPPTSPEDTVKEPGRVQVRVEYAPQQQQLRILVEDNGHGIPANELDDIFSLFVSRKGSRGTGLGLPVSQKIVREHGGTITVSSRVGQGSCFTIELPAIAPEHSAADS